MIHLALFVVAPAVVLAGFVKGVVGLGLPTISIALMATVMTPAQAAAIILVPSLITNIWQTFGGPYLRDLTLRLWPLLIGTCLGTWSAAGLMTGPYARFNTPVLGGLLMIYATLGLLRVRFHVARHNERWVGGVVGVLTGIGAAGTGVFAIPAVPFLQATGMEKEELVQAMGLFFTVSTVALGYNLAAADLLNVSVATVSAVALAAGLIGMAVGQVVRLRMPADTFRRWFFIFLLALGAYLISTLCWKPA
ncbi:MAG: sulfite exporter TauE/SafE family protein [Xanthobacteraceae bacterium]